jgi:hypothetical protein
MIHYNHLSLSLVWRPNSLQLSISKGHRLNLRHIKEPEWTKAKGASERQTQHRQEIALHNERLQASQHPDYGQDPMNDYVLHKGVNTNTIKRLKD